MDETSSTPSQTWNPGSFARDTLIYVYGALSSTVLRTLFADPRVVRSYQNWLQQADLGGEATPATRFFATGLNGGRLSVIARGKADEFVIECDHARFKAQLSVGFRVTEGILTGVFVADFEGFIPAAIHFANDLGCEIKARTARGDRPRMMRDSKPN